MCPRFARRLAWGRWPRLNRGRRPGIVSWRMFGRPARIFSAQVSVQKKDANLGHKHLEQASRIGLCVADQKFRRQLRCLHAARQLLHRRRFQADLRGRD